MRNVKARDLRFAAFLAATLALAGVHVRESRELADRLAGGYRKIDLAAVRRLIQRGELVDREAMYYRAEAAP